MSAGENFDMTGYFALQVDEGVLFMLADELAVREHCPLNEVLDERWLFFAGDGSPVRPQFVRGATGSVVEGYYLRPWASCGSCSLPQALPMVRSVAGEITLQALTARFAPPAD